MDHIEKNPTYGHLDAYQLCVVDHDVTCIRTLHFKLTIMNSFQVVRGAHFLFKCTPLSIHKMFYLQKDTLYKRILLFEIIFKFIYETFHGMDFRHANIVVKLY